MEHAEGRWAINEKHSARNNDGEVVIEQQGGSAPIAKCFAINGGQQRANAERIVTCVNLCRGYSTKELKEKGLVALVGNKLLERDTLLTEIKARVANWGAMSLSEMKAVLSDIEDDILNAELLEAESWSARN